MNTLKGIRWVDAANYAGQSHIACEPSIMNHRSVQMLQRYIRDGSLFRENTLPVLNILRDPDQEPPPTGH